MTYTSHYTVNNGRRYEGVTARTHNAALRRTRALFSGQGLRGVPDETRITGNLILARPGMRVVIEVEAD